MLRKVYERIIYLLNFFIIRNYIFSFYLYICTCMSVGKFGYANAVAHLWRPEDNLQERISSLLPCGSWES